MVSARVKAKRFKIKESVVFYTTLFFRGECCKIVLSILTKNIICSKIAIISEKRFPLFHRVAANTKSELTLCVKCVIAILKRGKCAIIKIPH